MFKLIPFWGKIGIGIGLALALFAMWFATKTIYYDKGINVSKVEIERYKGEKKKLETDLAQAQSRVVERVVTQLVTRTAYIDRVVYKNRDVIKTVVPKQFLLSKGWIYAYNQSIKGLEIDPVLAADGRSSVVQDATALSYISENNGVALRNAEKVNSLQLYITETQKAYENVNNGTTSTDSVRK